MNKKLGIVRNREVVPSTNTILSKNKYFVIKTVSKPKKIIQ